MPVAYLYVALTIGELHVKKVALCITALFHKPVIC